MIDRKRKVDVEKLNREDIVNLTNSISDKITNITDEAVLKVNKLLNIYGMEAKMQIVIQQIE